MLEFQLRLVVKPNILKFIGIQIYLSMMKFGFHLPALIRSAKVPCGVSSKRISPDKYCLSNSAFSPT